MAERSIVLSRLSPGIKLVVEWSISWKTERFDISMMYIHVVECSNTGSFVYLSIDSGSNVCLSMSTDSLFCFSQAF